MQLKEAVSACVKYICVTGFLAHCDCVPLMAQQKEIYIGDENSLLKFI